MMLAGSAAAWTNPAATGWGGDRLYLLVDAKDREAALKDFKNPRAVWITAWDTRDDRDEFVDEYAFQRDLKSRRESPIGDKVAVYTFGLTEAQHDQIVKDLERGALRMRRDGQPWSSRDGDRR